MPRPRSDATVVERVFARGVANMCPNGWVLGDDGRLVELPADSTTVTVGTLDGARQSPNVGPTEPFSKSRFVACGRLRRVAQLLACVSIVTGKRIAAGPGSPMP
jgi:hypothetical protein